MFLIFLVVKPLQETLETAKLQGTPVSNLLATGVCGQSVAVLKSPYCPEYSPEECKAGPVTAGHLHKPSSTKAA